MTNERSRITALDGVRFFSALLIFCGHFGRGNGSFEELMKQLTANGPTWVSAIPALHRGYAGVTVFYMLSGFVLQTAYKTRPFTAKGWLRFILERWARVYPTYILLFLFMLQYDWTFYPQLWDPTATEPRDMMPECIVPHSFVQRTALGIFMLGSVVPDDMGPFVVSWTLSSLWMLWCFFPLLKMLLQKFCITPKRTWLVIFVCMCWAEGMGAAAWSFGKRNLYEGFVLPESRDALETQVCRWWYMRSWPIFRLGEFVLGMAMAHIVHLDPKLTEWKYWGWVTDVLFFGLGAVLALLPMPPGTGDRTKWDAYLEYGISPLIAIMFVGLLSGKGLASRLLTRPTLVELGTYGLGVYLMQFPSRMWISVVGHRLLGWKDDYAPIPMLHQWEPSAYMLHFWVTYMCAGIAFHWWEDPVYRWLKRKINAMSCFQEEKIVTKAPDHQQLQDDEEQQQEGAGAGEGGQGE